MGRPKGSTNKKAVKETEEVVEIIKEEIETGNEEVIEMRKNIVDTIEVEKVAETDVEIMTENIKNAKKTGAKKAVKKVFDDEDLIPVASFIAGRTNYMNKEKPYDEYTWDKFGEIEEVRYGTLVQMKRKGGKAFKKMLYVLPEDAQKDLGLVNIYAKIGKLEEIINILDKPLMEALNYIEGTSKEVKDIIRQILINKLERKESIDLFVFKAVAEKLGMDLNLEL